MTQATLPQFKAEANRLQDSFNGKSQEYAIVERLLEDKGKEVKRWRLVRRIKKLTGQPPGNFSARISIARTIVKKFGYFIDWNGNKNLKDSAYRIFQMDVGLPEKVM
ncbi:MAG: hypothetical protein ACXABY_22720 [Candidatus Thorarchaeota archaeon]|jgi:hypothetical protein